MMHLSMVNHSIVKPLIVNAIDRKHFDHASVGEKLDLVHD
jgi:hypothetical protein